MKDIVISQRYGEGFLSYAKDSLGFKEAVQELLKLKSVMRDNPNLEKFLENKGIGKVEKNKIIDDIFSSQFSKQICNYLKFLLDRNRIHNLFDIVDYVRKKYAHDGSTEVLLVTAYPLDIDIIRLIKDSLETKLKNKVTLYMEIDTFLIGGIKIIVGNKILDGSIKGRLDNLKYKLKEIIV
jgi:F-type H+-transporting ATPase subunit delta